MNATTHITPPYLLSGTTLNNKWVVGRMRAQKAGESGGFFSVGYECTSTEGKQAFLKVIDLYKILVPRTAQGFDLIKELQILTQEVQGERDLLSECLRMDRVVTAIEDGTLYTLNGTALQIPIPFIVFELAEGNARSSLFNTALVMPASWRIRTLHQVAVGVWQMHGKMIAHQDLKLSNILLFGEKGAKLSDLGRSVQQGRSVPHDQYPWPGDNSYAPPEFAFGYIHAEFNVRRLAADLYLLGSCACTLFTGVPMNTLLYDRLPTDFHPPHLGGTFVGTFAEALPHLRDAFERVLEGLNATIPAEAPYRKDIVKMIREWCEPSPEERGHPLTRAIVGNQGNIYSLERYLSTLDNIAQKTEFHERRQRKQ